MSAPFLPIAFVITGARPVITDARPFSALENIDTPPENTIEPAPASTKPTRVARAPGATPFFFSFSLESVPADSLDGTGNGPVAASACRPIVITRYQRLVLTLSRESENGRSRRSA